MINVEGFKAFRGTMRIYPKLAEPFELKGDFLYKPNGCWYHKGRSYPAEICEVVEDETKGADR